MEGDVFLSNKFISIHLQIFNTNNDPLSGGYMHLRLCSQVKIQYCVRFASWNTNSANIQCSGVNKFISSFWPIAILSESEEVSRCI